MTNRDSFKLRLFREQAEVARDFVTFVTNSKPKSIKRLKARAGTGKTHTIGSAINSLNTLAERNGYRRIATLAFTGKAASQMRAHGIDASTIHSFLYSPVIDKKTGDLTGWTKNNPSVLRQTYKAICIDEGSMVTMEILEDLRSVGVPIYIMGDDYQLPSVGDDDFNLMSEDPRVMKILTHEDSRLLTNRRTDPKYDGIIHVMNTLLETGSMPRFCNKNGVSFVKQTEIHTGEIFEREEFDVVLCGTNSLRRKINNKIRRVKGYTDVRPDTGEKIICLKNTVINYTHINNGEIFTVAGRVDHEDGAVYYLEEPGVGVFILDETFITEKAPKQAPEDTILGHFSYGYCISVHKSQGSTFDNVLFVDEDVSYFLDRGRFRYTAVSRAAENLVIAR